MEAGDADVNHGQLRREPGVLARRVDRRGQRRRRAGRGTARPRTCCSTTRSRRSTTPRCARPLALCTDREEYLSFRAPGNDPGERSVRRGLRSATSRTRASRSSTPTGNATPRRDRSPRGDQLRHDQRAVEPAAPPSCSVTVVENCGLNVTIDQFEQAELITKAITGDFEVFLVAQPRSGPPGPGVRLVAQPSRRGPRAELRSHHRPGRWMRCSTSRGRPSTRGRARPHRPGDQHAVRRARSTTCGSTPPSGRSSVPGGRARGRRDHVGVGKPEGQQSIAGRPG